MSGSMSHLGGNRYAWSQFPSRSGVGHWVGILGRWVYWGWVGIPEKVVGVPEGWGVY